MQRGKSRENQVSHRVRLRVDNLTEGYFITDMRISLLLNPDVCGQVTVWKID